VFLGDPSEKAMEGFEPVTNVRMEHKPDWKKLALNQSMPDWITWL
jgi:hypothetical protein